MKKYEKPFIEEENIELEDIIAVSGTEGSLDNPFSKDPFSFDEE